MKKVLVTGSSGSLGGEIVQQLLNKNYHVKGLDQRFPKNDIHHNNYEELILDIVRNYALLKYSIELFEPDYIIHCAANIYGVGGFNRNAGTILHDDTAMVTNIYRVLNELQIKPQFIYISSSMVYENMPENSNISNEILVDTNQIGIPKTDYGLSKYIGERYVRSAQKEFDIPFTIWRPFNIITPFEKFTPPQGNSHVFVDMYHNIVVEKKNPLPIFGDGKQVRCFTWYTEVASCIVDHLENPKAINDSFNIGRDQPVNMLRLAAIIVAEAKHRKLLPNDYILKFETVKEYENDVRYRVPGTDRARDILGFEANIGINRAIELCFDEWTK